jgi:hypothetical protein
VQVCVLWVMTQLTAITLLSYFCTEVQKSYGGGAKVTYKHTLRASPPVLSMWLKSQDSKIYSEKVKMCWFSSGNSFFCTKFVQLALAGERRNTVVHLQKRVYQIEPDCGSVFLIGRS